MPSQWHCGCLEPASFRAAPSEPLGLPARPTADPGRLLVEEGVDRAREREIASIFALASGRVGTRASLADRHLLVQSVAVTAESYAGSPSPLRRSRREPSRPGAGALRAWATPG